MTNAGLSRHPATTRTRRKRKRPMQAPDSRRCRSGGRQTPGISLVPATAGCRCGSREIQSCNSAYRRQSLRCGKPWPAKPGSDTGKSVNFSKKCKRLHYLAGQASRSQQRGNHEINFAGAVIPGAVLDLVCRLCAGPISEQAGTLHPAFPARRRYRHIGSRHRPEAR
jgi:hypothetical protein